MILNKEKPGDDNYNNTVRYDLVHLIPDVKGSILDVGCASGATIKYLYDLGAVDVKGIDISDESIDVARRLGFDVYKVDLNVSPLPFDEKYFDVIILADVLEHLIYPWDVLIKIKTYLKDDGIIIISLPNIGNYKIIKRLIFQDRWDYEEQGILDKTHLRFFTDRTAKEMITNAGLKIVRTSYSGYKGIFNSALNFIFRNVIKKFTAVQFYYVAKKK